MDFPHWQGLSQNADSRIRMFERAQKADTDRHKWTRFEKRGSILTKYGTNQNVMVPTILFHIAIAPGRDAWDRREQTKLSKTNLPAKFWDESPSFAKSKESKTTIKPLAISIHPDTPKSCFMQNSINTCGCVRDLDSIILIPESV